MYQCRCHTCDTSTVLEDLETAQNEFSAHAGKQHEVVLERIDSETELEE